jgi:hypothetical protein
MRLYIDGVLHSQDISVSFAYNGTANAEIGRSDGTALWNGAIDDVRIYNRALSADEIKRLYKIGGTARINTSIPGPTNGLVGYWTFDGKDMSGVQAYDRSGNGNHGTLTNGPMRRIGKIGQALEFDGSDDLVNGIGGTSLNNLADITVSAWIKSYSFSQNQTIMAKDDCGDSTCFLHKKCHTVAFMRLLFCR